MNSPLSTPSTNISFFSRLINSKKKKQYILALVILIFGVAAFLLLKSMKKPPEEKPVIDKTPIVLVQPIVATDKTLTISSYGVIEPKYETHITAQVSGVVVQLSNVFVRGGFIKKGELLAKIDPSDYQAALLDAQAMVASAQASLQQEQAQGEVAKQEWEEITNAAPTKLSLRKPQLAQEKAKLKAAQASLLRAERNLQRSEIRAPFDAIIEQRSIGLGSFVNAGTQVGKLLNTNIAQIRLPIASKELAFLANDGVGAEAMLIGEIANKKVEWQARIVRNEGIIDRTSRMHYLVAEINDPYQLKLIETNANKVTQFKQPLRFGTYVKALVKGVTLKEVVTVARTHLVDEQLPVLLGENKLGLLPIKIIRQEGNELIIPANSLQNSSVESEALATKQLIITAIEQPVHGMKLIVDESAKAKKEEALTEKKDISNSSNASNADPSHTIVK